MREQPQQQRDKGGDIVFPARLRFDMPRLLVEQDRQQQPEEEQGMGERGDIGHRLVAEGKGQEDQGRRPGIGPAAAEAAGEQPEHGHVGAVQQQKKGVKERRIIPAEGDQPLQCDKDHRPVVAILGRTAEEIKKGTRLHPGKVSGRIVIEKSEAERTAVKQECQESGDQHRSGDDRALDPFAAFFKLGGHQETTSTIESAR